MKNIAIVGSSGAIGRALTRQLAEQHPECTLYSIARKHHHLEHFPNIVGVPIDYALESSIAEAADSATALGSLDLVLVATGVLHSSNFSPEKSLKDVSRENLLHLFEANTVVPSLLMKYFLPKLNRHSRSMFGVLSARVGSISDNRLGGWYSYRTSKAALNMMVKTAAIETQRKNKHAIVVGLHPGTVDSELSKPYQRNVPSHKLFTSEYSASRLIEVIASLNLDDSGKCFAWDGKEIQP